MKNFHIKIFSLIIFFAFHALNFSSADTNKINFKRIEIKLPSTKLIKFLEPEIFWNNLFGSKDKELILQVRNEFYIYSQIRQQNNFNLISEVTFTNDLLGTGTVYFSFGRLGNDEEEGVFFFAGNGVFFWRAKEKISTETLSPVQIKNPELKLISKTTSQIDDYKFLKLKHSPFSQDMDNNGLSDLILADSRKFYFLIQVENGKFIEVEAPPIFNNARSDFYSINEDEIFREEEIGALKSWIPSQSFNFEIFNTDQSFYLGDFDRDREKEILTMETINKGIYDSQDNKRILKFFKIERIENSIKFKEKEDYRIVLPSNERIFFVQDLNGDNLPDIIMKKSVNDFFYPIIPTMHLNLYYNKKDKNLSINTPDQILKNRDPMSFMFIEDWNKDGRIDFCFPFNEFSPTSSNDIFKFILGGNAKIMWKFFEGGPSGYPQNPTSEIPVEMSGEVYFGEYPYPQVVKLYGDFNGDGYSDFALRSEPDKMLVFYYDSESKEFSKKPDIQFKVEENYPIEIKDINNDGISDIYYPYWRKDFWSVILFLSSSASQN